MHDNILFNLEANMDRLIHVVGLFLSGLKKKENKTPGGLGRHGIPQPQARGVSGDPTRKYGSF